MKQREKERKETEKRDEKVGNKQTIGYEKKTSTILYYITDSWNCEYKIGGVIYICLLYILKKKSTLRLILEKHFVFSF